MAEGHYRGSRLIKNSVLNILNSLITIVVTTITSIVVARILKPDNYGIYNLILWFTGIFTWAVGMGLTHAVTKYISEYQGRGEHENVSAIVVFVLKIELVLTIAVTAILIFFKTEVADYFFSPNEAFYFFLAFIGLVPGIVTAIFSSAIDGLQKFEYFTWFQIIVTPLSFASKLVVLYLGFRIDGLLVVSLVFSFINVIFFYFVLRREEISLNIFANPLKKEIRTKIGKYNATVAAILVADKVVWDKSENFFLGRFCSAAQIGFYNLGFNVVQRFMSVLPSTFWRVLFPAMSGYFGSGDHDKIRRLFYLSIRYLAFFAFPAGVMGILLSYQILHYLYGHEYVGAKFVMQILFFSSMFSCLSKPSSAILYGTERQSFILKYGMVLAVVNIALDILLIKHYGALGAAICYAAVTIAGSTGGLIYTARIHSLNFPFKSLFKIVFSTIIMAISMEIILKQNPYLPGFILSVVVGAFVYFVSSIVLGGFEDEDYLIMQSVQTAFPGKMGRPLAACIGFLSQFKDQEGRKG
ncbi:MAG: hypothetical protein A2268_08330 [Candidatus Raymondbacteria bacterium RifOxyA12_full_50_37]|uniref:Uncharacterized protein n=1 Tax=Candidatus Raymondbacteria bacterium RIFOXYD12_FULL_49_13 TaxID=1817890 RepID=A0A1F7F435_UNCRA|nr:MAG: hypothetical protein A2268_08330 [Candidatus Raymondbacteria bacterium RifOxyA12_full_50_37]OGJ90340.1 MAG: hypothetical protein A2248_17265 [Candidatus Raymondbacteria bacterium RIFOXYA2_FULL_49_16]OGK01323.1 MAG: hypothetical protein A2519_13055 [Candidatus Raymondbacteria bacterium RIFOXYD12_FULL_49_13]OGK07521.1 MAG: hypothetical protein A2487_11400 [Candidatus Raymondbacteria bacterium RifOxyC12_full_50_8]OGP43239.1 MAG: hypothetical protein A2324_08095 [Candidatus Raymondbacteria 